MASEARHVGLALAVDRVTACARHRTGGAGASPLTRSATLRARTAAKWDDLEAFLRELSEAAEGRLTADVALLPPLCEWSVARLPRLGEKDTRRFLAENADRLFLQAPSDPEVSLDRLRVRRRSRGRYQLSPLAPARFCAVVDTELVTAIRHAAKSAGIDVGAVVPAAAAWADALGHSWRTGGVLVSDWSGARRDLLWAGRRTITRVRSWATRRGRVSSDARPADDTALRARRRRPAVERSRSGLMLAAANVRRNDPRAFLSRTAFAEVARRRARRRTIAVVAGLLMLWGGAQAYRNSLENSLRILRDDRAAIAEHVAIALDIRARREAAIATARALDSLEQKPGNALAGLTWLAHRLPGTAHLAELIVTGDSVFMTGYAEAPALVERSFRRADCRVTDILSMSSDGANRGFDATDSMDSRRPFGMAFRMPPCVHGPMVDTEPGVRGTEGL